MGELRDDKEMARRINRVGFEDIMDMEYHHIFWLVHNFSSVYLVRLLCSRGENKWERGCILSKLKNVYNKYRDKYPDYFNKISPFGEAGYFSDIDFDIETNSPLLPDEEENADEESPLPNPNSSPSGEAGRGLLEACIAQLERENEALKQQIEELQSQPQTSEVQQASTNEALVELFSYVMYEDEKNAKEFIESAKGRSDVEITDLVAQWVDENKISSKSCRRDLWRLLHAYKLYSGTESNYNTAMRKKQ